MIRNVHTNEFAVKLGEMASAKKYTGMRKNENGMRKCSQLERLNINNKL